MEVKKFKDDSIRQARINVDFKTKKVNFSYPTEHDPEIEKELILLPTTKLWAIITIIILILGASFGSSISLGLLAIVLISIIYFIFIPQIITIIIQKLYKYISTIFPRLIYYICLIEGISYYTQTITRLDTDTYEVPIFNNIYLEYELTGEFMKCIEKIDIIEYPFKHKIHTMFSVKEEENQNPLIWRAIFKFSKPPQEGELKLKYM